MAGLQSVNQIWEDWLRWSLTAIVNLRYCMTLKSEWTKSRHTSFNKIWEYPLRTNLNAKIYLHIIFCKNIKWPWTEKVKVRVTQKGCNWRDLIKVYKHAKHNVCNHLYEWKQTLTQRLTKIIKWPWTEKVKVRITQKGCSWRDLINVIKHAKYNVCNH